MSVLLLQSKQKGLVKPGLLAVRGWWVTRYERGDQGELAAGDWRLTGFPHGAVLHVLCLAVCTVSVAHWVISKS